MARVPQGRIILFGTLSNAGDIWQTSFAIEPLATRTQLELQNIAVAIETLWNVEVWGGGGVGGRISTSTKFLGVRVDDVRDPGGVVRTATSGGAVPVAGLNATGTLPPEVAEVVSLRTGLPGPRRRGRMYFPPLALDQTDLFGHMAAGSATDLVNVMASFFSAVNASPVVASTTFVASDAGMFLTAVESVQVGLVFDAQRRRRSNFNEVPVSAPVTP